jgi:hypothetical protein
MIAKRRSLATHDFLLIVIATMVLVVSLLPMAPPRQQVRLRDTGGRMQTYSLLLDDPILDRLRREASRRASPKAVSAALAVARWQAEVANFYAEQTKPPQIQQVSFIDRTDRDMNLLPLRMQHETWLQVRDEAQSEIDRWESGFQRLRILEAPSPIELGALLPAHRPAGVYLLGLLAGFVVAAVFAFWAFLAPTLQVPFGGKTTPPRRIPVDRGFDFAFEVPRDWIRVHQSPSVWLRRTAEAVLVIAAIAMLIV